MLKATSKIVLALVFLLASLIGYASPVNADLPMPKLKMKDPYVWANLQDVSGTDKPNEFPGYPNQFYFTGGWANYDAFGYQVYIKDIQYSPWDAPIYEYSGNFGEKTTTFITNGWVKPDGNSWSGYSVNTTHTYFITINVFDKEGQTIAIASSIHAPSGIFQLYPNPAPPK
jgi:hypothetical protein